MDELENKGDTISIIMPAHNEAARLEKAALEAVLAASRHFDDYELIIVNDASSDDTGRIADDLARENSCIRVLHHVGPPSLGGAFKSGLEQAAMEYVTVFHGKGGTSADEIGKVWTQRKAADLIVPYLENANERPLARRALSQAFTSLLNILFGLRLKYYNHFVLCRRSLVDSIVIRTDSYAFQAEILIKLIRSGHNCTQVGIRDDFADGAPTRSIRPRNILGVVRFLLWTLFEIHLTERYRPSNAETMKAT